MQSPSPTISVILPTHRGASRINRMLKSLGHQTLDHRRIEVLVVMSSPADGTSSVVANFAALHPRMRIVCATVSQKSRPAASNCGLDLATGDFITFVEDDDEVSPRYLEGLLDAGGPDVIAAAWIAASARTGGATRFDNDLSRGLSGAAAETVPPREVPQALWIGPGKAVSRAVVGDTRFEQSAHDGSDVLFWTSLAEAGRLPVRVVAPASGATYIVRDRIGASSPAYGEGFESGVAGRIAVIERLARLIEDPSSWTHASARAGVDAEIDRMVTHLHRYPDHHAQAVHLIEKSPAAALIPWSRLNAHRARDLVVSYCFPPTADTSANVAARRVLRRGVCVDVVSNRMPRVRGEDPQFAKLLEPYLGTHWRLDARVSTDDWNGGVRDFVTRGWEILAAETEREWPYRSMYSRIMWPASHLLAGYIKIHHPGTRWTAEMSDPLGFDTVGALRTAEWERDEVARVFVDALESAGVSALDHDRLSLWIEHITYALADEIVFTNANQLEFMMSRIPDSGLESLVREKATVSAHPTPPDSFYSAGTAAEHEDTDRITLAYFGTLYDNRGLGEVLAGISAAPSEVSSRLHLHVFGRRNDRFEREIDELSMGPSVTIHRPLPYLDSLATARTFDVLVVNDTDASRYLGVNPYLPSKVADYLGSGRPIWSIVEPDSPLSGIPTAYRSRVGDPESIQLALGAIACGAGSKSGRRSPIPKNASNDDTMRSAARPSP